MLSHKLCDAHTKSIGCGAFFSCIKVAVEVSCRDSSRRFLHIRLGLEDERGDFIEAIYATIKCVGPA